MIGYAVFLIIISITMFFCFVDYKGVISSKLLLLLMFLIMAFITSNADMVVYKGWYDYINSISRIGVTDPAFGFLMYIGNIAGLDYSGFLVMLTVIGLCFVWIVFKKYSLCPAIILALYFAFVFLTLTIQIRAFIAETVLYILIVEMINKECFNLKKFCIVLIGAILFHASSLFFILLLLIPLLNDRKKLTIIVAAAIAAVPFSAVILRYVPIPIIQSKIDYYFITHRASYLSAVFLYVLLYICILWFINYAKERAVDSKWRGRLERLLDINMIGLIACAMIVVFSSNFYRMIRIVMIVDFIILGNYYIETKKMDLTLRMFVGILGIGYFLGMEFLTMQLLDIVINNSVLGMFFEVA